MLHEWRDFFPNVLQGPRGYTSFPKENTHAHTFVASRRMWPTRLCLRTSNASLNAVAYKADVVERSFGRNRFDGRDQLATRPTLLVEWDRFG